MKKKLLKTILIILLTILLLVVIHTTRNFIIITNLQNNIKQYSSSTNYHLKTTNAGTSNTMIADYYTKDGKQVVFQERKVNNNITKISMYNNGEKIVSYYDTPTDKIVKTNIPSAISVNITSYFEGFTDNTISKIWTSMLLKIKKVEYNSKTCYIVSPLFDTVTNIEYIEKDTGLCVKSIMFDESVEKEYEFNNVTDEIFIEPDISQYRIEEDT
ncbi:MAG: hypothetical protein J6A36_06210 [Clostridia bacterium]|nr:hypothetical protein [Clostridia bacterium]